MTIDGLVSGKEEEEKKKKEKEGIVVMISEVCRNMCLCLFLLLTH